MKYYFWALGTILAVCVGCASIDGQQQFAKDAYHAPPAAMMQRPGPMVDGPGPGVLGMMGQPGGGPGGPLGPGMCPPGMCPPGMCPPGGGMGMPLGNTQVKFIRPVGMQVGWQAGASFAESQVIAPGRYDFQQGAVYQLKLTGIPEREQSVLYPTLEVRPVHPTTAAYLAHNVIPIEITDEDLEQVETNNFVTKVIYLPDAKHQDLAIAGVETLVSTRLRPGVDPVAEAERRGTIMSILRLGNKDLETPGSLPMGRNDNGIRQASYSGMQGQFVAPTPIASVVSGLNGIPSALIMGGGGMPGQSPYPVAGMGSVPAWGQPLTGTPIGLAGPPHLPYGGRASLKSHTVRNLSDNRLPDPVDHMLIDVSHSPGYSLPAPVKHISYSEKHPVFAPGEVSHPARSLPPDMSGGAMNPYSR